MRNQMNRRSFFRSVAVVPAGLALGNIPAFGEGLPTKAGLKPGEMPMVLLGGQKISRLITGSNTINAGSHLRMHLQELNKKTL
jgi:hypothetical protein